jgi:serine/threonine protein kinase
MSDPVESARLDGLRAAGYELQSLVGRGGMAYVYKAQDTRLGRIVAVKVLAPELAQNEEFRLRFLRESRLAASLDHPNIIPIYEAGEADGHLYLAMRFVEGADLKVLLKRRGTLPVGEAMWLFGQVGAALDSAHAAGLVHRDVKPANILVAPAAGSKGRDHVYLSDFGLTKRASSLTGVTATGIVVGTMDYVAPEQIGGKPVDARTDVYALGCVVYQTLTGKVPFIRDDDAALLWAHLMEMPQSINAIRPDVPAAVDEVIATAMAKGPEARFASCGEFITALAEALGESPTALPTTRATDTSNPPPAGGPQPSAPGWTAPPATGASQYPQAAQLPLAQYESYQSGPQTGVPYPNQYSPTQFPPGSYPPGAYPPAGYPTPQQYSPTSGPQSAPPQQYTNAPYQQSAPPFPYSAPPQQGSGIPYPYSAPPAPGSGIPYPYSAPPGMAGAPATPAPAKPTKRGGGRKFLIGGLALALVVVIGLLVVLVVKPFQEGTKHYTASNVLPASFDYPAGWKMTGAGTNIAFSTHAKEALALFGPTGGDADWSGIDKELKSDPNSVAGVYTTLTTTEFPTDTAGRNQTLTSLLPSGTSVQDPESANVGTWSATRSDGGLSEPNGGSGSLRVRCFIATPANATDGSVLFVFFASDQAWDKYTDKFDALIKSVQFSTN